MSKERLDARVDELAQWMPVNLAIAQAVTEQHPAGRVCTCGMPGTVCPRTTHIYAMV